MGFLPEQQLRMILEFVLAIFYCYFVVVLFIGKRPTLEKPVYRLIKAMALMDLASALGSLFMAFNNVKIFPNNQVVLSFCAYAEGQTGMTLHAHIFGAMVMALCSYEATFKSRQEFSKKWTTPLIVFLIFLQYAWAVPPHIIKMWNSYVFEETPTRRFFRMERPNNLDPFLRVVYALECAVYFLFGFYWISCGILNLKGRAIRDGSAEVVVKLSSVCYVCVLPTMWYQFTKAYAMIRDDMGLSDWISFQFYWVNVIMIYSLPFALLVLDRKLRMEMLWQTLNTTVTMVSTVTTDRERSTKSTSITSIF